MPTLSRRRALQGLALAVPGFSWACATSSARRTTGARPTVAIDPVPFTRVTLNDGFWAPRLELNRTVTIPHGFAKCEQEGRLRNFERAARVLSGVRDGGYEGQMPFDDTDVYKLLEGASYSLQRHPDAQLGGYLDAVIAKIAAAQEPDGYLTTYKTIDPTKSPARWVKPGPRWTQELYGSHELYNSGHLFEAAWAHHRATGQTSLLDVARRNADLLCRTFGPDKLRTPPGHQIVETGLVKLAAVTGERRYERLARFFLDQRGDGGGHRLAGPMNQDHLPVTRQREAVGHAVRAMYMYCGMADIAALDGDAGYREAGLALWDDVFERKVYLTGAVGARRDGEAFGAAFELPNRTGYGETCASIGSVYWNQRLFLQTGDARYVDMLERTLYNGVIAGVSLSGDQFFYTNPLEADGRFAFNRGARTRAPWFDCSCCPTNLARFIPAIPDYIYATQGDVLYVNLFAASRATIALGGGSVALAQSTLYPWDGAIAIAVTPDRPRPFELRVRIPGWARGRPLPSELYRYAGDEAESVSLSVNGQPVRGELAGGYASLSRTWSAGDVVSLNLPMPPRRVTADRRVVDDRGKVALARGPLVYCAEAADHRDASVLDLAVPDGGRLTVGSRPDGDNILGGACVLGAAAVDRAGRPRQLTAIPYYAWSNRGPGEMAVWFPRG
ncbi:MAG TPA: glycoside hydrolase family 127 protein [Polyangia bacterium]|nr:glycoside hydrolase family 127 protein [Polyangia bacterium]